MRNVLVSMVLAASIAISGVPVSAAAYENYQNKESVETEETSAFDETLAELYRRSMEITDQEVLQTAEAMQSDFSLLSEREDAEALTGILQSFEAEKAQYLLGEAACSYDERVRAEWDRQSYYTVFGLGEDNTLVSLLPKVQVKAVNEENGRLGLVIYEWNTEGYTGRNGGVSASAYGYTYTLELEASESGWRVAAVTGSDVNYADLEGEGVSITADGISYEEIEEEDAEEVLVGDGIEAKYTFTYNVNAAIEYADTWALSKNPAYDYYGGRGGDCANFVSQCLYAGGLPITEYWAPTGANYVNWVGNNELRKYLVEYGFGSYVKDPSADAIRKGDLIYYNWKGKTNSTNHVTIVVGRNNAGEPIIDSHTADKLHSPWKYGGAETYYSAVLMKENSEQKNTGSSNSSSTVSSDSAKTNGTTSGSSTKVETVSMYRLYNRSSGEHFYTSNAGERANLIKVGWISEGVGWYAPAKSKTPIYRFYNRSNGDHHYTIHEEEKAMLIKAGWAYEGILGYSDDNKEIRIYRQYNPNAKSGAHNFAKSESEVENLKKAGWKYEGIAWYGVTKK